LKIIIIDNYDSFTYNIAHYVEQFASLCDVVKVDKLQISELDNYDKIIFSPGPGLPKDRPILFEILKKYSESKPILGICFGHQAIAEYYGASLFNMDEVHHGVARETIVCNNTILFNQLPDSFKTGRYHSWAVEESTIPDCIEVTAKDKETNTIMALKHKTLNICGVQFHPESVLTEHGLQMIKNWLNLS
jgi:anthranilate synthase component 2